MEMDGNGVSVGRTARFYGIRIGTVFLYTERVLMALLCLKNQFITWPDYGERDMISRKIKHKHGLPGCTGIIDGTHVNSASRPAIDPETFFNRKQHYSFNVLLVSDDRRKIRFYLSRCPANVYDNTVFGSSALKNNANNFFGLDQYLFGDSGFPLNKNMLVPYKGQVLNNSINQAFNKRISLVCVII